MVKPLAGSPTTRMQKRTLRTRQRLLAAALARFCAKGFLATTIEDITEQADLGKGTFYRHFTSKENILVALAEQTLSELGAQVEAGLKTPRDLDDALEKLLNVHTAFFTAHPAEFALLFQGQTLLRSERDATNPLDPPFEAYLGVIARLLGPLLPAAPTVETVRRVVRAIAGFHTGVFAFDTLGVPRQEVEKSFEPLRRAMISAMKGALLERAEQSAPPAASVPTP
ncbi:MAG: TetR/AcrR family transcriptional regulator [bacterium]|nr:TetR/AcrR family transcriptional regulator [bacterium]